MMPERILSYPAHVGDWPDEASAYRGMQVIRLWRFADTDLRPTKRTLVDVARRG
jgi:hypothetical protein